MCADGGIKSVTLKVNGRRQTQRDAARIIVRQSPAIVSPPAALTWLAGYGTTHALLFKKLLIATCHSGQEKSVEMSTCGFCERL